MDSGVGAAATLVMVQIEEHTEESARAVQDTLGSRWYSGETTSPMPLPGDWWFSVDTGQPLRKDTVVALAPTGSGDVLVRVRGGLSDGAAQLAVAQVLFEAFQCTEASLEEVPDREARDIVMRVDPQRPTA